MRNTRIIGQYGITLIIVMSLNFMLPRLAPGDPAIYLIGEQYQFMTEEEKMGVLAQFDLDLPLTVQYFRYWKSLFTGDWGYSTIYGLPVREVLLRIKAPFTLLLMGSALVISSLLAVVFGVISAAHRGRRRDVGILTTVMITGSLPPFWVAMLFITFFSAKLGWFPSHGAAPVGVAPGSSAYLMGVFHRLVLPLVCLVFIQTGNLFLTARASMATTLDEDFIMLAHARGLKKKWIFMKHALPNAILPIYTNIMLSLGHLIGGAMVIETVFTYPGIGKTIYESVYARDFPLLQGAFMLLSFSVIVVNLLTDLLYPLLDPRVKGYLKAAT